ncbi:phytanoyl-CoA dioxygenase family protein [Embleya sp. NBC_00896]|uniref:phytanoyl-CoA dioxygenase family protein n=1 Tax=Embleya sp. NBC_00896 TaxID=2975961 RepID=UPI002F91BE7F|nr:phytanoyl-CoA dioxygenase family protein [Embleya sp. NBC_00896]
MFASARNPGPAPVDRHAPLEVRPGPDSLGAPLRRVVDEGRLVVIKRGLQHLNALEPLRRAIAVAARETLPADAARTLERDGIEQLHAAATVEEATALRTRLETLMRPIAADAILDFAATADPEGPPVYVSRHLGVRTMLPHAVVAGRDELAPLAGFMVPNALHVDSWFNTTLNSVNLWIALGRVRPGNGLLVYPDLYRRPVRRVGYGLAPDQELGAPVRFTLDAGDILVFSGDHVHASETNTTDETRWVLTKRVSIGAPRFNPKGSGWVPYDDPRLLRGPFRRSASLRSRATRAYGRHLLRTALRRPPGYERPQPSAPSAGQA